MCTSLGEPRKNSGRVGVRWRGRLSQNTKPTVTVSQLWLLFECWDNPQLPALLTYTTTSDLTFFFLLSVVLLTELRTFHILGKRSSLSSNSPMPSRFLFLKQGIAVASASLASSLLHSPQIHQGRNHKCDSESPSVSVFPVEADSWD